MQLGPRKAVHVIRAGSRQILLASGNDGVRFLCDLTGQTSVPADEVQS
jgi:hypothetical protein